MASYAWRGKSTPASAEVYNAGPRAKCDQVIYEAIAKAAEIIVASRGNSRNGAGVTTTAAASTPGTSRFNLQVPEIQGVRSILLDYRQTLHVPIRLDVYYQHEGNRRELLERWCLEYVPASMERFLQAEGVVTQDPLVQLRHVCKRIVLWLRTLFCWTRLLPAQSLSNASNVKSPIGFSIYVNTEGTDDISDLTQNQGFRWQGQPSPVVTPYGELGWQVVYSPNADRLCRTNHSVSRPIPKSTSATYAHNHDARPAAGMVPQSAPAYFDSRRETKFNSHSVTNTNTLLPPLAHQQKQEAVPLQQNTYDPSRFYRPRKPLEAPEPVSPKNHQGQHHVLRRRHTSIGQEVAHEDGEDSISERALSGLSLALMTTELEDGEGDGLSVATGKRHAALHELPPHLVDQTPHHPNAPVAAEYGYAYNNHIPWQKIQPSSNAPVVTDNAPGHNRHMTSSPSVLASTPPTGAFWGGTFGGTPPNTAPLIPPRSSVTPPFQPRPAGFVQEPPAVSFLPPPAASHVTSTLNNNIEALKPPSSLASLDLLHCSPFQLQQTHLVASAALVDPSSSVSLNASGGELRRSLWSVHTVPAVDEYEDMPFAVDDANATTASLAGGSSSLLYQSAQVASFAQRCSANNRLQLFSSNNTTTTGQHNLEDTLSSQLAEFRSFGATLQTSSTGSENTSTSTPISLRS